MRLYDNQCAAAKPPRWPAKVTHSLNSHTLSGLTLYQVSRCRKSRTLSSLTLSQVSRCHKSHTLSSLTLSQVSRCRKSHTLSSLTLSQVSRCRKSHTLSQVSHSLTGHFLCNSIDQAIEVVPGQTRVDRVPQPRRRAPLFQPRCFVCVIDGDEHVGIIKRVCRNFFDDVVHLVLPRVCHLGYWTYIHSQ